MTDAPTNSIWIVLADFLSDNPSTQEIIDYQFPKEHLTRSYELRGKAEKSELTAAETEEMIGIIRADDMMCLLQVKARRELKKSET